MGEHARLPPSSADIWVKCHGWRELSEKYPEAEDSEAGIEGTEAHELAVEALKSWPQKIPASKAAQYTEEMVEGAEFYASVIGEVRNKLPGSYPAIEFRSDAKTLVHEENFGTMDCIIYKPEYGLYIWDYKFGRYNIDVFENWQLINYAAIAIETFNIPDEKPVVLGIIQPRGFNSDGPSRKWETTVKELRPYIDQLRLAAEESFSGFGRLLTGSHCRFCKALNQCPAARSAALDAFEFSERVRGIEPSIEELANELRFLKRAYKAIEYRIASVESEVEASLASGKRVPYFSLKRSPGNRFWTKDAKEINEICKLIYGIDIQKPKEILSPAQAEKKGIPREIIDQFTDRGMGPNKLTADKDADVRKAFS